jgi:hypothetical protein
LKRTTKPADGGILLRWFPRSQSKFHAAWSKGCTDEISEKALKFVDEATSAFRESSIIHDNERRWRTEYHVIDRCFPCS